MRILTTMLFAAVLSLTACKKGGGDNESKAIDLMTNLANLVDSDSKDCDKMATDLKKFAADNKDTFQQLKDWESKMSADDKKKMEEKNKDKMEAVMKKMMGGLTACGTNQNVAAAMKDMPM